mmetsp:Transcript_28302/g.68798  ORF Transcript_28302/g.68798 Transcript_28302/m.68798 type:complete len:368 (+) Transcript_28302:150-1253(+)
MGSDGASAEVVRRLEAVAAEYIDALVAWRPGAEPPAVHMVATTPENVSPDSNGTLRVGDLLCRRSLTPRGLLATARFWAVVDLLAGVLDRGSTSTLREIYYRLVYLFDSQEQSNDIVRDICAAIECPRHALGVGASIRGAMHGDFCAWFRDECIDGRDVGGEGLAIPGSIEIVNSLVLQVRPEVRLVLVIEKMGVFHRLVHERLCDVVPCVLLCGAGFPSLATRRMLRRLLSSCQEHVSAFALTDYNPHGVAIFQTYRAGARRSAATAPECACPSLQWLGLSSRHIDGLQRLAPGLGDIPSQPLTERDWEVSRTLLKDPAICADRRLVEEIDRMSGVGKVELQALFTFRQRGLSLVDIVASIVLAPV